MILFHSLLIVIGLSIFEVVSSIDNAIINAQVLSTMGQKARKFFLFWGLLFAVFIVRGVLPWIIIWMVNPTLGPIGALTAAFSNNPAVHSSIEQAAPVLLLAGGTFLLFLFFHWLFLEQKEFGLPGERFFQEQGVWFFAVASILLAILVWFSLQREPIMAFAAVVGSTAFFISIGFRENAEKEEKRLLGKGHLSDMSKVFYLIVIDSTFSMDGVLGAFAFTLSVPLILIGNGIGAVVVRQVTVSNINRIQQYVYLKNGAMYSILFLGIAMVLDSFLIEIPFWVTPLTTIGTVLYFFFKSKKKLNLPIDAS